MARASKVRYAIRHLVIPVEKEIQAFSLDSRLLVSDGRHYP
jgi:hypothetical protein